MGALSAISLGEWAAKKMGTVGLTGVERAEKRGLQRRLASHQSRQDAKVPTCLLKNQMSWDRKRRETGTSEVKRCLSSSFYRLSVPQTNDFRSCAGAFQKTAKGKSQKYSEKPPKNGREGTEI